MFYLISFRRYSTGNFSEKHKYKLKIFMDTQKKEKSLIVVGMSGGVDSSVTALLLKEKGYDIIGLFMKNWDEKNKEDHCSAVEDFADVQKVCKKIDIPCHMVNFVDAYKKRVFSKFLEDFEKGFTPNPDILCNREIKFNVFLHKAKELGAKYLATGHYAQIEKKEDTFSLLKGIDDKKDQSYFLYTLNQKVLSSIIFPLGHMTKKQVKQLAKKNFLPTAEKKESMGLCFIGKRPFRPFLKKYLFGYLPGNFEDLEGNIVGTHEGYAFYTIGQRKGLKIGGKGPAWFVVGKDISRNIIFVAQGENHPSLFYDDLTANELSWIEKEPEDFPFTCMAKIRYRQKDTTCTIEKIIKGIAFVTFEKPQRAITARQAIVFYKKNRCIGGGMILSSGKSYYHKKKSLSSFLS